MKGKGKARAKSVASDEDEIIPNSEDELEYDEKASVQESSDSGSEFELSETGSVVGSQDEDDITPETNLRSYAQALEDEGIDADDVLMDFAIKESLNSVEYDMDIQAGTTSSGAGSSKVKKTRNAAAALRAAAAERRASRGKKGASITVDDDYEPAPDDDEEAISELSVASEEEEEPLSKKKKGKAKAKATVKVNTAPRKVMTMKELRDHKSELRRQARLRRAEEASLRKKLGRRLTQVTSLLYRHRNRILTHL